MKTLNLGVVMDQGADFNYVIGLSDVNGPIDITGYKFLGEMRLSTAPGEPIAGGEKADGALTFSAQPAPLDTINVNGKLITFVAATPGAAEVLIDSTLALTIANLLASLKASTDAGVKVATYEYPDPCAPGLIINVTFGVVGVAGNAFTLVTGSASITVSGATLTGGIDPAEFVFTILNQVTNKGQVKWSLPQVQVDTIAASVSNNLQTARMKTPYVFDVKMEDTANIITRIIQGVIYVSPQATQEAFP